MFRHLFTRSRNCLIHLIQDIETTGFGLLQRNFHYFTGNTVDLDVHLQRVDTVGSTCHFEIHVAQMILITEDIGQNGEIVTLLDQTHGNTGHRRLDRHAGIHQRQAGTTYRSHGRGAVGLGDFRHHPDCVRKIGKARHAG